jgi:hypothetical protein
VLCVSALLTQQTGNDAMSAYRWLSVSSRDMRRTRDAVRALDVCAWTDAVDGDDDARVHVDADGSDDEESRWRGYACECVVCARVDRARHSDALRRLVSLLCERGESRTLCEIPFVGMVKRGCALSMCCLIANVCLVARGVCVVGGQGASIDAQRAAAVLRCVVRARSASW